jgi:hypothetical protein
MARAVQDENQTDVEAHRPVEYRAFRLSVKRRLLKDNQHLKSQPKDVMQRELDALFLEVLERYKNVLNALRKTSVV